jgi:gamma-glutamyltranspeptidase/glutathione hydrolase
MVPPSAMPLVPGRTDSAVVGQQGLVSAADPRAADAGAQILRKGDRPPMPRWPRCWP